MAVVGQKYLTIADVVKMKGGGGKIEDAIVEILNETSDILLDAAFTECNDGSSHKSVIRTGLPTPTWKKLYGYTNPSKSTNAQVQDTTGILEAYSVADVDLVNMSGDKAQVRLNEARAHLEAMNQEWQDTIIYGNKADNASKFDGLSIRYNAISATKTNIGYNIINGGAVGADNTSIWAITWGENHCSLLYPKGTKAGIERTDDGIVTETDTNGGKRKVYQEQFKVHTGLTLKDWRSTGRIANIDLSELQAGNALTGGKYIEDLMIELYHRINRHRKSGKTILYANEEVLTALHRRAKDKASNLTIGEYAGKPVTMFLDIPIKSCDQILNAESLVA